MWIMACLGLAWLAKHESCVSVCGRRGEGTAPSRELTVIINFANMLVWHVESRRVHISAILQLNELHLAQFHGSSWTFDIPLKHY